MRNWFYAMFLLATTGFCGCCTPAKTVVIKPQPYTRIANPDTNAVQLQIALRKFVSKHHRGPAIWLAGVMHIGDPEYYRAVQTFLATQTVVLYEGVNTEAHRQHVENASPNKIAGATNVSNDSADAGFSMQSTMAKSLGLVFQLEAIDYDRTNFFNSDLSIPEIEKLIVQAEASPRTSAGTKVAPVKSSATFDALLQVMDGSSFMGKLMKLGMQYIGSNPKLQAMAKLTLIEMIGQIQGDFSEMQGLPPDMKELIRVLIQARNQNVIADLKTELKKVPRSASIAVFYGTGHMEDLEKRVRTQLGYEPSGEKWMTVFEVNMQKTGLAPGEVQMMRNLIKSQLDQMK